MSASSVDSLPAPAPLYYPLALPSSSLFDVLFSTLLPPTHTPPQKYECAILRWFFSFPCLVSRLPSVCAARLWFRFRVWLSALRSVTCANEPASHPARGRKASPVGDGR